MNIQKIFITVIMLVLVQTMYIGAQDNEKNNTWVFTPDSSKIFQDAMLDLSYLNEDVAGEKGWMTARDGEFYLPGSDRPFRGWSAGLRPFGTPYEMDQLKQTARLYARLGVNQVREMADANADLLQLKAGDDITKINLANLDKMHRLIAAMKDEGIYVTFCPWWFHRFSIQDNPRVDGFVKHGKAFYWSRDLRDIMREWYRQILTTENPYTGLSIAEDPSVNIFELQNEQNLLFWGLGPNICDEARWQDLGRQFTEWTVKKYGSLEKAESYWGFDDAAQNKYTETVNGKRQLVAPQSAWWWSMYTEGQTPDQPKLYTDALEFIVWLERDFVTEMSTLIKDELGYGGLVSGGNWRAPFGEMEDLSTYCKIAPPAEVANYHVYINFGMESPQSPGTASYKVSNGSYYRNGSILANPMKIPTNFRQYRGKPMIATEMGLPHPNDNNLEGIVTAAAYGSLIGLDQITWLQTEFNDYGYHVNGANRFNHNWPHLMGQFPAAALLYRLGYVDTVEPVVTEKRSLQKAFAGSKPSVLPVKSKDPLYATPGDEENETDNKFDKPFDGPVDPLAFLVGPVEFEFTQDAEDELMLTPAISEKSLRGTGRVTSRNGQLVNIFEDSKLIINTPEAVGCVGPEGSITQSGVTIQTQNRLSSVLVVSLDGKTLADSKRVLIQAATPSHLSGADIVTLKEPVMVQPKNKKGKVRIEAGTRHIKKWGRLPFVVDNVDASVSFETLRFSKATAVDLYGIAMPDTQVQMKIVDGKQQILLPEKTYYTILEK